MTKLKNIKIEIVNKVENNQQSKNKYKNPLPEREIEENYESIENNEKAPYTTPIYELMRPNINTMRNYTISNEERDKITEQDINTVMKPSRGISEAGTEAEPEAEAEAMAKPFNMNNFEREFKNLKNDLLFNLKQINYKYNDFKNLPNVIAKFKDYIFNIYINEPELISSSGGILDLAIVSFAEEVKDKFSDKFD